MLNHSCLICHKNLFCYLSCVCVAKSLQACLTLSDPMNGRLLGSSVHLKANHSISQLYKSMPQPVTLKKLKLNGFMKTYKTF